MATPSGLDAAFTAIALAHAFLRDFFWGHELEVGALRCQMGTDPHMCHVLIIEDEPLIALLIRDVLEDEGATSFSFAATQDEAISAAAAEVPAFITSDVKLLEGTGPLAVEAIQSRFGPVPVVFITASPDEFRLSSPLARIVTKPFDRNLVVSAFHELSIDS